MRFVIEGRKPYERVTIFFATEAEDCALEQVQVEGPGGKAELFLIMKAGVVVGMSFPMARRCLPAEMLAALMACGWEGKLVEEPYPG